MELNIVEIISETLSNKINLIFVIIIFILAFLDLKYKKDLKSQIVSIGVLGTFVGIFIGLQDFNPEHMKESINNILIGLKTAFFTSIVGMFTAILLVIYQKLVNEDIDDEKNDEKILLEISEKLNLLEKLNNIDDDKNTDKIIGELERIRTIQTDTRDGIEKTSISINELKNNSNKENQELINILNTNFNKMNNSLELAIEKLSKGATEEIIKALKQVIEEFNQELQTQFGENFVKLNESVINLVEWQNNYKSHIETLEEKLILSVESIEKSKESLKIISEKNEEILNVYQQLKHIIEIYDRQINELNKHLETYATLSNSAESMFSVISNNIDNTTKEFINLAKTIINSNEEQKNSFIKSTEDIKKLYSDLTQYIKQENDKQINNHKEVHKEINNDFINLSKTIINSNEEQKNSFIKSTEDIKELYSDLTQYIKQENNKQINNHKEMHKEISNDFKMKFMEIKNTFDILTNSIEKNKKEIEIISNHFKNLGEQIPIALKVSLEELNRGLTALTNQFKKDYKEIMDKYKGNL